MRDFRFHTSWSRAPFLFYFLLSILQLLSPLFSFIHTSLSSSVYFLPLARKVNAQTILPTMLVTRGFSLTNFVIGSSALCFQIFVLYPWHHKLDEEFTSLRQEHARLLEDTRERHKNELRGIRKELELLNERAGSKKGGFWS
jgi:hypothetical protein